MKRERKLEKISTILSVRVFLMCLAFGFAGSILTFTSQKEVFISDHINLMKEISASYYREINNEIEKKAESAEEANRIVQRYFLENKLQTQWRSNISRGTEGVYRADDGTSGAIYLSRTPIDSHIQRLFDTSGELWEIISPHILQSFMNFWTITSENFIRITPKDWALEVESDHDLTEHLYYTTGAPENNPDKKALWTPVYYDSVLREWMTSLIIPLYDGDRFMGVTGSDLPLMDLLSHLESINKESYGFKFLLFDSSDNVIFHPEYLHTISDIGRQMGETLSTKGMGEEDLTDFIQSFNRGEFDFYTQLTFRDNSRNITGFAYPLGILNWRFIVYREESKLNKPIRGMLWKTILLIMLMSLTLAFAIRFIAGGLIIKRINNLFNAIQSYRENRKFALTDKRNDEISLLSDSFKLMIETINLQFNDLSKANREMTKIMKSSTMFFIVTTDRKGVIKEYNRGAEILFGFSRDEVIEKETPVIFNQQEELQRRSEELTAYYKEEVSGFAVFTYIPLKKGYEERQWRCRRKNGQEIDVHLSVTPIYGEDGSVTGFLGMGMDITEKKRQEEELMELRRFLSSILNSISSPIMAVDSQMKIKQWNSAAMEVFGEGRSSLSDVSFPEILTDFSSDHDEIGKAISQGTLNSLSSMIVNRNGETRFWNMQVYPLSGEENTGAVIHIEDRTETVRIQELMIQNEKMLSVGGLAAGMAHEINNPLAGIMQNLDVLNKRLTVFNGTKANKAAAEEIGLKPDKMMMYLEKRNIPVMIQKMRESGLRISEIVSNILSFSRNSVNTSSLYNLDELIRDSLELARTDYDLKKEYDFKNIEIEMDLAEDIPMIPCEKNKIRQVLLNIFNNGAQAMITAETPKPAFHIHCRYNKETDMVVIKISDNGPGMTEEVRKRIFEPFFTTKEEGKGTGLGLSVSYFIIRENHGGEMMVESSPGKGATFKITLPCATGGTRK